MAQDNFKVGYLFFKNLFNDLPSKFSFELGDSVIFSTDLPDIEDKKWREWLGLKWNNIKESNVIVKTEVPTNTPDVLDGENKELEKLSEKVYIALQLLGDFKVEAANFVTGSKVDGEIDIREWAEYHRWYCTEHFRKIKKKDIENLGRLLKRLLFFYSRLSRVEFVRFNRGLNNFQKGCTESYLDFRLPYFVRSLEALALPDKGQTEKQFKKRIAKWWPKGFKGDAVSILGEIYEMRSDFEHLHGLKERYTKTEKLRGHQCEEVARNAFQTVLLDGTELESFSTDARIRAYWQESA